MVNKLFSVHDSVAKTFIQPFAVPSVAIALRHFTNCANDKQTDIGRNPSDFVLYELGEFDSDTGIISVLQPMVNHGFASNYITKE